MLFFEDDEIDILIKAINQYQMVFHPIYAPIGVFSIENILDLQNPKKDVIIIADNNFISPICEIVKNGTLKDADRLQKVALFVTFVKFLGARATCGLGLLENDTAMLSSIPGEETRQMFLHGLDNVPPQIWKNIAFGYIDRIPSSFLYKNVTLDCLQYNYANGLHLLNNEAAIIKIVQLIRTPNLQPIEKFDAFMRWYANNLIIAESIIVYAAMVFSNSESVAKPKSATSDNYLSVVKGIKNQAWDITYITYWSTEYSKENDAKCVMFATDDKTQKKIVANIIPIGQAMDSVSAIFCTKRERKVLERILTEKFGSARIKLFEGMSTKIIAKEIKNKIICEYDALEKLILAN